MIRCLVCLVLATVALAGCQTIHRIDTEAYREYHASRWEAVVSAYVRREAAVILPALPLTPRVCTAIEPAYGHIIDVASAVYADWERLDNQSLTAVQFVAEMLDVLVSRDTLNIEKLAPQIDRYFVEHHQLREAWLEQRGQVAVAVEELDGLWCGVWPDHGLGLNLLADSEMARSEIYHEPDSTRRQALEHYHTNEYDRLAMVYLDYSPATVPQPKSHIPAGCDSIAGALRHLEAGLLVRYSMDQAIEQDVLRIQELAAIDLSRTPWQDIEMPRGRYARPRVSAAIARLKLLKYLDVLLTDSLDILNGEVERQWHLVWPTHNLETNVFAHAGLLEAAALPPDPLAAPTLRH